MKIVVLGGLIALLAALGLGGCQPPGSGAGRSLATKPAMNGYDDTDHHHQRCCRRAAGGANR